MHNTTPLLTATGFPDIKSHPILVNIVDPNPWNASFTMRILESRPDAHHVMLYFGRVVSVILRRCPC